MSIVLRREVFRCMKVLNMDKYDFLTRFLKPVFFLNISIFAVPNLDADNGNYFDLLPGGRASMMGGAYTSISDDPAGTYYNPAGLTYGRSKEISVNTIAFYEKTTKYLKTIIDKDFVQNSSANFPVSFGSLYKMGSWTISYAVLTNDYKYTKQNDYFSDISDKPNFAANYSRFQQEATSKQSYGGGLSYGLGKNWSLGISSFYYLIHVDSSLHQKAGFRSGELKSIDQSITMSGSGLSGVIGLIYRGKNFSFGLSYLSNAELTETIKYSFDYFDYNPEGTEVITDLHEDLEDANELDFMDPDLFRLGASWQSSANKNYILLSLDVNYMKGMKHSKITNGTYDLIGTSNFNLGCEIMLTNLFFRFGVFTNNSMHPDLVTGNKNQRDHIDYQGQSLGVGYEDGKYRSSIGFIQQIGTGKAQKILDDTDIQEVRSLSRLFLMTLSYGL